MLRVRAVLVRARGAFIELYRMAVNVTACCMATEFQ